jgi:hypothetical protein
MTKTAEPQIAGALKQAARGYHGTGEQAIEWALTQDEPDTFLRAWQHGDAQREWPDFYEWLDAKPAPALTIESRHVQFAEEFGNLWCEGSVSAKTVLIAKLAKFEQDHLNTRLAAGGEGSEDVLAKAFCLLDSFAGEGLGHVYGNGQVIDADITVAELTEAFGIDCDARWWRTLAHRLSTLADRDAIEQSITQYRRDSGDEGGCWRTCSGCYECEDGYPNGHYPHSAVLGCTLGGGCSDCGGIGAVWDNIDYEDMARETLADDAAESDRDAIRGEADERIAALEAERDAFRQQAINRAWNWRMCDAYGREEYAKHLATEIDETHKNMMARSLSNDRGIPE